jgi:tetratricopeptide (TPR) repeat protein
MNVEALYARISQVVDQRSYLTPVDSVPPRQREAMAELRERFEAVNYDPVVCRGLVQRYLEQGRIDRVMQLSALNVVAASPQVRDYAEAARLAGEQEWVSMEVRGPHFRANLASADRHRGVIAFLQGHHEVALDYFTRALERQRTAENLGNVLCSLLSLGDREEAESILRQVRQSLSRSVVSELEQRIDQDPDLAGLRMETS